MASARRRDPGQGVEGGAPHARVLCVGALTRDWQPDHGAEPCDAADPRWIPGGAVLYASFAVAAAGATPVLVTTCDQAFELPLAARAWQVVKHVADRCARFENVEARGGRRQRVWEPADTLPLGCGEAAWTLANKAAPSRTDAESVAPWILLAPVLSELPYQSWLEWARGRSAHVALVPQGWLRGRAEVGWPTWLEAAAWAPSAGAQQGALVEVVSLSEDELDQQPGLYDQLRLFARTLVVTRGARGALLVSAGQELRLPAAAAGVVDTTGAGDAFAGALVARLAQGASLELSARFASAVAAATTESWGAQPLCPTRVEALSLQLGHGVRDVTPQPPA